MHLEERTSQSAIARWNEIQEHLNLKLISSSPNPGSFRPKPWRRQRLLKFFMVDLNHMHLSAANSLPIAQYLMIWWKIAGGIVLFPTTAPPATMHSLCSAQQNRPRFALYHTV
jgi:hypothetical protein